MNWKTVPVFICSTFADMVGEREVLHKTVFPNLRQALEAHGVRLEDVDLNWGLRSDPTDTQAILRIVENELNRASIIIAILGERFGAIPSGEFDSWTALSIYAGLVSKTVNLLVFHRASSLTNALAKDTIESSGAIYRETEPALELEQDKLLRRLVWLRVPITPYSTIEEFSELVHRALGEALGKATGRGTVFISYSRKDIELASRLLRMLESVGFTVWLDLKGIAVGEEWLKKTTAAIDECDAVLMLVSKRIGSKRVCDSRSSLCHREEETYPCLPPKHRRTPRRYEVLIRAGPAYRG